MSEPLDTIDAKILDLIQKDASLSVADIAERVGLSSSPCWRRIKRMEEEKLIRITAVTNIDRFREGGLAYIWIELEESRQTESVSQALAAMDEFGFVGVMMGRFDILAITMVRNTEHLAEFLHGKVNTLPGVRHTESTLGVNFVKHDYRMARIVS